MTPTEPSTIVVRDLSPESRILIGPSPPKGTRRRPAKNNTPANRSRSRGKDSTMAAGIESQPDTHTLASYIEHVESLDPQDDEHPLQDFTQKWLSRPKAEWPTSADPRLYTFMHTTQFYDPAHQEDRKELAVINTLRHKTEIAEINGQPLLYNVLRDRVLSRVEFLAQEMILNKILAYDDTKQIQMVKAFRDVWRNREDYWEKKRMSKTVSDTTASRENDIYDTLNLYDDDEDDCVPADLKKKSKSKAKRPISQAKTPAATTTTTPLRRKANDSTTPNNCSPSSTSFYSNKRARTETSGSSAPECEVRKSTETSREQMTVAAAVNPIESYTVDLETTEHIRFAEQVLRMPSMTEIPSTPHPAATSPRPSDSPSRMMRDHPMTPQSPAEKWATTVATDQVKAQSPIAKSSNTESDSAYGNKLPGVAIAPPESSSATSATSIQQSNTASASLAHSHLSSPAPIISHGQSSWWSKIVLTLQNSDGAFDLDNEATGDECLSDTNLSAFFEFFSQRSGVPLARLDWLTLTMKFGVRSSQIQVINKMGGEEEWRALKTKIEKLFEFVRDKYPQETKFYIWIEIGR